MESLALFLGLAFVANKAVSVIKAGANGEWNTFLTQFLVWIIAFVVMCLAASAQVTEHLVLPGMVDALGDLDFASLLILALVAGSTGSVVFDFKKAIDGTDTAAEPSLMSSGVDGE